MIRRVSNCRQAIKNEWIKYFGYVHRCVLSRKCYKSYLPHSDTFVVTACIKFHLKWLQPLHQDKNGGNEYDKYFEMETHSILKTCLKQPNILDARGVLKNDSAKDEEGSQPKHRMIDKTWKKDQFTVKFVKQWPEFLMLYTELFDRYSDFLLFKTPQLDPTISSNYYEQSAKHHQTQAKLQPTHKSTCTL